MKHTWLNCSVSFLFTFKLMKNAFHSFYLWDVVCICVCVCTSFYSSYHYYGLKQEREMHFFVFLQSGRARWHCVARVPYIVYHRFRLTGGIGFTCTDERKEDNRMFKFVHLFNTFSFTRSEWGCVLCVSVRHCVNRIRKRFLESGEGRNTNFFLVPSKLKRIRIGLNQIETNMRIETKIMRDHITIF